MRTKPGNGPTVDFDRLIEDVRAVVRDGQELLKARYGDMRERALERARTTDKLVRANPYRSLGIIFGVGVVFGLLACGLFGRSPEREEY